MIKLFELSVNDEKLLHLYDKVKVTLTKDNYLYTNIFNRRYLSQIGGIFGELIESKN